MDIESIKARIEATTPAPWVLDEDGDMSGGAIYSHEYVCSTTGGSNAQFIAHAREDVPALLAALGIALSPDTLARALYEISAGPITNEAWAKARVSLRFHQIDGRRLSERLHALVGIELSAPSTEAVNE